MAANDNVTLPAGTWTLITTNNVTGARVQNIGINDVLIQATIGLVPPVSVGGAVTVYTGQLYPSELDMTTLFPGIVGANRYYAYSVGGSVVSVSHA